VTVAGRGGLAAAVTLLTRVPVPRRPGTPTTAATAAACAWFPVVGALTGGVLALLLLGLDLLLPAVVAALLVVLAEVLLTGALHLDGLADCADATGGRDAPRRLAIMKDHATGVYGAAAVALDLGLRVACLASLPGSGLTGPELAAVVVTAWTLSRTALLAPALLLPYARPAGTGARVVQGLTTRVAAVAGTTGLLLCGAVLVAAGGTDALPLLLAAVAVTAATTAGWTWWAATRLGGATGDVLGAVAETAVVASLVGVLVVL
jgi:adenosylcobinamide-GDP ribazoletransferase